MSSTILTIAGGMFGIPLAVMLLIAGVGGDIPPVVLGVGGWSMALGIITGGIGAAMAWFEG